MPDLTKTLLPRLQSHRLPELNLPEECIQPAYHGQSILNTPNSVCSLLGIPPLNDTPALIPEILEPLGTGAKKVLVILMDALALHRLQAWMADEPGMIWNRLADQGVLAPVTSISPSTTSAAITTYWTATAPATHGVVGYETWLKEYGVVANMIAHRPITFYGSPAGILADAGFNPATFLPVDPLGPHLAANGVEAHAFQHYTIIDSGLSQMFFNQVTSHSTSTAADLWVTAREVWEQNPDKKLYAWAYWPDVDGLSHFYGPDNERNPAEFSAFSYAFEHQFLNKLSADQLKDTVVILTADHGQLLTNNKDPHYELRNHPDFTRRLHMLPTGENRLAILHVKPGQMEAVREYVERTWPNQFTLLESAYAVEKGLFGPGPNHPDLLSRVGDLIAVSHGRAYWWWSHKPNPITGRHGGLGAEEMLVPFLAARF